MKLHFDKQWDVVWTDFDNVLDGLCVCGMISCLDFSNFISNNKILPKA